MGALEFIYLTGTAAFGVLATAGYAVITLTPAEYRIARCCFWGAAVIAFGIVIMWGVTTAVQNVYLRIALVAICCALIGVGLVETLRWIGVRQELSSRTSEALSSAPTPLEPEELIVNISLADADQLGTNNVSLNINLINNYRHDIIIRSIYVYNELVRDHSKYAPQWDPRETCVRRSASLFWFLSSSSILNQSTDLGTGLGFVITPSRLRLNDTQIPLSSPFLIHSTSITQLSFDFSAKPIDDRDNISSFCVVFRITDQKGVSLTVSCPGSFAARNYDREGKARGKSIGPPAGRFKLLPISSDKQCEYELV